MFWPFTRTKRRLEAERQEAERERSRAERRCARVLSVDPAVHAVATELAVRREFLPEIRRS